jgi:hypothetical protein
MQQTKNFQGSPSAVALHTARSEVKNSSAPVVSELLGYILAYCKIFSAVTAVL